MQGTVLVPHSSLIQGAGSRTYLPPSDPKRRVWYRSRDAPARSLLARLLAVVVHLAQRLMHLRHISATLRWLHA